MSDSAYYLGTIANNLERATDTLTELANNTATQRERIATACLAAYLAGGRTINLPENEHDSIAARWAVETGIS